jgi:hypothetical protein
MKRSPGPMVLLTVTLAFAACLPARAGDDARKHPHTPNLFVFSLGGSIWPELHDLDPSGSPFADDLGHFHTWGVAFEFAYQRRVARLGNVDVLIGGDLGLMSHENAVEPDFVLLPFGETLDGSLNANTLYLTPAVRFVVGDTERWRFLIGAGAGLYVAEFDEQPDEFYRGYDDEELWDETALGGYLSAAADRRLWKKRPRMRLRIEAKTHFVDFGDTAPFAPGDGPLTGPAHSLLFGFVWGY